MESVGVFKILHGMAGDGMMIDLDLLRARSAATLKLGQNRSESATSIRNNIDLIPDFGERHRQGTTIATAVDSPIDPVVSKPFVKEQQRQCRPRCPLATATPHQNLEQRPGRCFPVLGSTVPCSGRSTPDFLPFSFTLKVDCAARLCYETVLRFCGHATEERRGLAS